MIDFSPVHLPGHIREGFIAVQAADDPTDLGMLGRFNNQMVAPLKPGHIGPLHQFYHLPDSLTAKQSGVILF